MSLDENNYSKLSYNVLFKAIDNAQIIINDVNSNSSDYKNAIDTLKNAVNNLVDISKLKNDIDNLANEDKNEYISEYFAKYQYYYQQAKDIFETTNQLKGLYSCINKQFIHEKIIYENNIKEYKSQDIHKICLWSNKEVFYEVSDILKDKMELAQMDVHTQYYEIIQKGFNKGKAIQRLQKKLGIIKKETICFGDGQNDITMFQESDIAVAMKNSHQQLKEMATSICEDIFDDGIYKELKRRNII